MTLACSSVFESDLVCLAYGFEKLSPKPKPSASATGGDLKITVNKSSRKKTSLESIRASIRIASQTNNRTYRTYRTYRIDRSYKSYRSYSFRINPLSTRV